MDLQSVEGGSTFVFCRSAVPLKLIRTQNNQHAKDIDGFLLTRGNNSFPETIIKWIAEQLLTNFYSLLGLHIGQFMRLLSGTFEHQTKMVQMTVHGVFRGVKSST